MVEDCDYFLKLLYEVLEKKKLALDTPEKTAETIVVKEVVSNG